MKTLTTLPIKSAVAKTLFLTLVMLIAGAFHAKATSEITFKIYIDDPTDAKFTVQYPLGNFLSRERVIDRYNFRKVESGEYAGYYLATMYISGISYLNVSEKLRSVKLCYYPKGFHDVHLSRRVKALKGVESIEGFGDYDFSMNDIEYNICEAEYHYYNQHQLDYWEDAVWNKVTETTERPIYANVVQNLFCKEMENEHDKTMTYVIKTTDLYPAYVYNMQEEETVTVNDIIYSREDIPGDKLTFHAADVQQHRMTIKAAPTEGRHYAVYQNGKKLRPSYGTYRFTYTEGDKLEVKFDADIDVYLTNMKRDGCLDDEAVINGKTYTKEDECDGGMHLTIPADEQPIVIEQPYESEFRGAKVYVNTRRIMPDASGVVTITNVLPGEKVYVVFEDKSRGEYPDYELVPISGDARHGTMTYSSHEDLYFPEYTDDYEEEVEAYKILRDTEGSYQLEQIYGRVPAGTGLFLRFVSTMSDSSKPIYHRIQRATDQEDYADLEGNILLPLYKHEYLPLSDIVSVKGYFTVYEYYNEVLESWLNNDDPLAPHAASLHNEAYIQTTSGGSGPKPIPTGIDTIDADGNTPVVIEGIYTLSGIRINTDASSLAPGYYIINGKKMLIK
ncbi:MAG: hypothetical protein HUK14_00170 [Muribaculaceae bacterium]|nr:hypothetical protein [Muribaculaceae bacterium]